MRLYALKLSQPTVFAFTFLFLIVMNLEQVRCMDFQFLYHSLSQKYLTMHKNGSVTTQDGHKFTQCMQLDTVEPPQPGNRSKLVLSIYNPTTRRYLCFNKNGLLVGRKICTKMCHFIENFDEATYMEYKLAAPNLEREYVIAFSKIGKPKKIRKKTNAQIMKVRAKSGECINPCLNETMLRHRRCRLNRKHGRTDANV